MRGYMILILRWTAFIVGLAGLYVTLKRGHEGKFTAAILLLLFDTAVLVVFVSFHAFVEWALDKVSTKKKGIWWL